MSDFDMANMATELVKEIDRKHSSLAEHSSSVSLNAVNSLVGSSLILDGKNLIREQTTYISVTIDSFGIFIRTEERLKDNVFHSEIFEIIAPDQFNTSKYNSVVSHISYKGRSSDLSAKECRNLPDEQFSSVEIVMMGNKKVKYRTQEVAPK